MRPTKTRAAVYQGTTERSILLRGCGVDCQQRIFLHDGWVEPWLPLQLPVIAMILLQRRLRCADHDTKSPGLWDHLNVSETRSRTEENSVDHAERGPRRPAPVESGLAGNLRQAGTEPPSLLIRLMVAQHVLFGNHSPSHMQSNDRQ